MEKNSMMGNRFNILTRSEGTRRYEVEQFIASAFLKDLAVKNRTEETRDSHSGLVHTYGTGPCLIHAESFARSQRFNPGFFGIMDKKAGQDADIWKAESAHIREASAGDPEIAAYAWDIVHAVRIHAENRPIVWLNRFGEGMHPAVQHALAVYLTGVLKGIPCTVVIDTVCPDVLNAFRVIAAKGIVEACDLGVWLFAKRDGVPEHVNIKIGTYGKLFGDGALDGLCINQFEMDLDEMLGL